MADQDHDRKEYDLMILLDALESMLEDMDEFGIRTREQLVAKIAQIHRDLDQRQDDNN